LSTSTHQLLQVAPPGQSEQLPDPVRHVALAAASPLYPPPSPSPFTVQVRPVEQKQCMNVKFQV
jgi:hypothetical protein